MTAQCRHHQEYPCPWCYGQDFYFNGSTQSTFDRMTEVVIGSARFTVKEGHKDPRYSGLTLRPAAVTLAQQLYGLITPGMRVLELGAGLGLPGRVAAFLGAKVTFSEAERTVAAALTKQLKDAGLDPDVYMGSWMNLATPFDAVIGSEILFDRVLIREAFSLVGRVWTRRGPLLFTDPGRRETIIERDAPLRGLRLQKSQLDGHNLDGHRYLCHLWHAAGNHGGV